MNLRNAGKAGGLAALIVGGLATGSLMAYGVTEEVPLGSITGGVVMAENGKPLPKADVILTAQFSTDETIRSTRYAVTDDKGGFRFSNIPAGKYVVAVYGRAHSYEQRDVLIPEGKVNELAVKAPSTGPSLDVLASNRVFLPGETPQIQANGIGQEPDIQLEILKAKESSFADVPSVRDLFTGIIYNKNTKSPEELARFDSYRSLKHPITRRDIEGVFVEDVSLPEMDEGVYLVRATSQKQTAYAWLTISRIALTAKQSGPDFLAYVVDLKSGQPISGAPVKLYSRGMTKEVGVTGADGILKFSHASTESSEALVIAAESGASRAYASVYSGRSRGSTAVLWTQTDRPVYRPGDKVQFRGVVRIGDGNTYRVPASGEVQVTVFDPDETVIKEQKLTISATGSYSGEMEIDKISLPGSYRLNVSYGEEETDTYIPILTYRKPEVKITVTPEEPVYTRGQRIRMKVKAETFTGEPLVGAEVNCTVFRRSEWRGSPFEDDAYFDEEYESDYKGEYIDEELTARTNELGEAIVSLDTSRYKGEDLDYADTVYTIEASVADAGGRSFNSSGSVRVGRGLINLVGDFSGYLARPGEDATLELEATDSATGEPARNLKVTVTYFRDRRGGGSGEEIPAGRRDIQLDSEGRAVLTVRPETAGSFIARYTATDSKGNRITGEAYLWVTGGEKGDWGDAPDLQVILDKKNYAPADTARAVIRTKSPGGSALVTLEADRVLWSKVVPLTTGETVFEIDGLSKYVPNAWVTVCYVREKEFSQAERSLNVNLTQRELDVTITPDRTDLKPGETVTYLIDTKDADGKPVVADVALGVVDEGIYQLREDNANPLREFYPRRWSSVQTNYSFPSIYLDGDEKGPVNVEIRRKFEDTAYWNPSVLTGPDGQAVVTVKLPDNLTSWRATATAFTAQTAIGRGKSSVVARKELMARMSLPAFMTQSDQQQITGTVANTTESPLDIQVRLDASGVETAGERVQKISVPPRATRAVSWPVTAGRPGTAKFTMTAWTDGGPNDGLELRMPIEPKGLTERTFLAGSTPKSESLSLELKPGVQTGELVISLAPTLVGSLLEALPYLIDYPYGCVEQTLSRFVPAVQVQQYMNQAGYRDPAVTDKIPEITKMGLIRLRMMQNIEGGWGWWEYDSPDPSMTAKVLEGLWRAEQAGVAVNPNMIERAMTWSKESLSKPDPNEKLTYVFEGRVRLAGAVLLREDHPGAVGYLQAASSRDDLSAESLADLACAWHRYSQRTTGPAKATALQWRDRVYRRLMTKGRETEAGLTWTDTYIESNARALEAVALIEPNSGKVEKILRSLMQRRRGFIWFSTQDTAAVITGAMTYVAQTKELGSDFEAVVTVNGKEVGRQRFAGPQALAAKKTIRLPYTALKTGANQIGLMMSGAGRLYYGAELTQNAYADTFAPRQGGGVTIKREYVKMESQRLEDGTLRLLPARRPSESFASGDVFRCRLTITTSQPMQYVAIEDPIPSNCRIVDADTPSPGYEWGNWWSRSVFLDNRAAFFVTYLDKGTHVIEYAVRAEIAGKSVAMPATIYPMYEPQTQAATGANVVSVK